jgi:transcriptional regulator with XRE-family HTH domain
VLPSQQCVKSISRSETSITFGNRLRWVREKHGLSLEAFGHRLGVGRSYLSRLENGERENPSGLLVAMACHAYNVRQDWLLRGDGKPFEVEYLNRAAAAGKITGREPPWPITLEERAKSLGEFLGCLLMAGNRSKQSLAAALTDVLANPLALPAVTIEVARVLSAQLHSHLRTSSAPGGTSKEVHALKTLNAVLAEGTIARRTYERLLRDSLEQQNSSRKVLTDVPDNGNVTAVKSTMANLLDRLNKATSPRGMKSKLAKVMGVPLSNVSQWLSGAREPGGETTLRLLHWVEQKERQ